MKLLLHLALVGCAALVACGTPGAPRPPSLELPRPVDDFAATRKGDKVTLTWTPSRDNTDGTPVRRPGITRICRGVNDFPMTACTQMVADVSIAPVGEQKFAYTDTLPSDLEQQFPTGFSTYGIEMFNRRGRTAGLSNQVRVPLAPAPAAPIRVEAQVTPEGVTITTAVAPTVTLPPAVTAEYHVYRNAEGNNAVVDLGRANDEDGGLKFLDRSAEWDKTYLYHVAAVVTVTQEGKQVAQFQGEDSPEIKVMVKDVFPPAQPVGLQAVFSGVGQKPFIDLTWASNQEADLAGYNVYRREQGGEWTRINPELVKAPAFRDNDVGAGHRYDYSVSAVDLRGNESTKSEPGSETVPK